MKEVGLSGSDAEAGEEAVGAEAIRLEKFKAFYAKQNDLTRVVEAISRQLTFAAEVVAAEMPVVHRLLAELHVLAAELKVPPAEAEKYSVRVDEEALSRLLRFLGNG